MAVKAFALATPNGDPATLGGLLPANMAMWTWPTCANGDTGAPALVGDYADLCAQFDGTFGAGGTVVLQGSNDGASWFTLTDVQQAAISKTAAALEQVAECPLYIRPAVTAGDGTTSINVRLIGRRGRI